MNSFDKWYVTKITTYVFSSKADENLARHAFKAGMERAAEIAKDNYKLPCFVDKDYMCYQAGSIAEAIRKEIE